jgi:hypothetical protein
MRRKLWSENLNGRKYSIEVGVAVKITLKWMLNTIYIYIYMYDGEDQMDRNM